MSAMNFKYSCFGLVTVLLSQLVFAAVTPPGPTATATATTHPATESAESSAESYKAEAGPLKVDALMLDWVDAARDKRPVPVKIYYPSEVAGPFPVIIFSHGLGGSREGYAYLGQHWASHGYMVVHPQHVGSDTPVFFEVINNANALKRAAGDPINAVNRAKDVSFVIDQLTLLNNGKEGALKGKMDLAHIGVGGHSFGAWTALAIAGQIGTGPLGKEYSWADPRVKAIVAMSSPTPKAKGHSSESLDKVYGKIFLPVLHMTGTKDAGVVTISPPDDRRIPFDHTFHNDQYLVIFAGGDHMVFSGHVLKRDPETLARDTVFHRDILMSTTAFWDAYLKSEAVAKTWLAQGGFAKALGSDGTFEKKLAAE